MNNNMQALILAGGEGKRLKKIIKDRLKPMALIREKPFLEYLIRFLIKNGITEIILSVGYKAEQIIEYFSNGKRLGINIEYAIEKEKLGTGGGLKNAESFIYTDPFWVLNGDSISDIPLNKMYCYYININADFLIALKCNKDTERFGSVEVDDNGKVINFLEKSGCINNNYINVGTYLFNKNIFQHIELNKEQSLEYNVFPRLIGKRFFGYIGEFKFIDIGTPESYFKVLKKGSLL